MGLTMRLRLTLWLLILAFTTWPGPAPLAGSISEAYEFHKKIKPGGRAMAARYLGAVRLASTPIDGRPASNLSGLVWDARAGLLYALSDDGYLLHLRPQFTGEMLSGVDAVASFPLQGPDGRPLESPQNDAEGLSLTSGAANADEVQLAVSFDDPPRILRYRPNGQFVSAETLPGKLGDAKAYEDPSETLEAITAHPQFGLLTAPTRPLKDTAKGRFRIYALDGKVWDYPPLSAENSMSTDLAVGKGDDLLVLERNYASLLKPIVFAVRRLPIGQLPGGGTLTPAEVIHFNNRDGWNIDNFEALAHHQDNRFFVLSDDNAAIFQKTLLIYFQALDPEPAASPNKP
jgi:hypothetical protein